MINCSKGHALDEANTYWRKTYSGSLIRECRQCKNARSKAYYDRMGRPRQAGCALPSDAGISAQDRRTREAAEIGSALLLAAIRRLQAREARS